MTTTHYTFSISLDRYGYNSITETITVKNNKHYVNGNEITMIAAIERAYALTQIHGYKLINTRVIEAEKPQKKWYQF